MGTGGWKTSDWDRYSSSSGIKHATSTSAIYKSKVVDNQYLPKGIIRESCDSDEHPNSSPIIIGLDVTGSMDHVLSVSAKKLGVTVGEIINRKVLPDPQILFAAIDDYITTDNECLQVTQFESDIRIAQQLTDLKFHSRGGGNRHESYADLYYFAARHTSCDAIKKGRKGVIITIGDDGIQDEISEDEIMDVFGDRVQSAVNVKQLVNELNRDWEIFHISVAEGGSYSHRVVDEWNELLGTHSIVLDRIENLPEVIVSLLQALNGESIDKIASSWDGSTAVVVKDALSNLAITPVSENKDIVVF